LFKLETIKGSGKVRKIAGYPGKLKLLSRKMATHSKALDGDGENGMRCQQKLHFQKKMIIQKFGALPSSVAEQCSSTPECKKATGK